MGFTTSNLSLYHTFSKTPVDSNTNSAAAQLGNAINKSGHTVQSNEIWTESIPFFGLAATTTAIHTKFSATAKVNDLVKDSDGKIWQRNSTIPQFDASGSLTSTFADLWFEKTTSITSNVKVDGAYPTTDGALVDGSYLLNSEGVPTVKYYEKRKLTILTADNNANTNSDNKASRLQIDGKWIDQFIGVTDIYVNGSAAVSYAPVLRKTASDSPMQAGPGKGYMDYCATGLILWESSAAGTEVIDCFEYVGAKLDATVAKLSAAVFGSGTPDGEDQPVDLVTQVSQNTAAINVLKSADTVEGSIAHSIKTAIGNLGDVAVKSDIKISEIKVKSGSTTTTLTPDSNKSVTVEIPEVQAATTSVAGVVTISDNTAIATTDTSTAAATVAAVAATRSAIAGEMGALSQTVASNKSELEGKITAVETAASTALETAKTEIKGTIDALDTRLQTAESGIEALTTGDNSVAKQIETAANTIKGQSLEQTGTLSGMFTVQTVGTVGTGITAINISDAGLAQAIADAKSGAEQTAATNLATARGEITTEIGTAVSGLETKLTTGEGSLGAKVAALETATGTTLPAAIEQALTDAKAYSNSLHTTSVTYHVTDTLPTVPSGKEEEYKGRIYLVLTGKDGVVAADGARIEYMYVNEGTEEAPSWDWEQIGTTTADLSGYAKSVTINGQTYTATADNAGALDLGTVVTTASESNHGGYWDTTQSTTLDFSAIYTHIASNGTLTQAIATANDWTYGVSKLFTDSDITTAGPNVTDTAVSVHTAQTMYDKLATLASGKVSSVTAGYGDPLTGLSVTVGGIDTAPTISVTNGVIKSGSIPATAKVVANGLIDGTDVIETEKIALNRDNGDDPLHDFIPNGAALTTWVGDMPNLQCGYYLFAGCAALESFCGDLSSVTDGCNMFDGCSSLTSFTSDLSSMTNGSSMFYNCAKLTSFTSDLSSLTNGTGMFQNCNLDTESLELIAESLPTVTSGTIDIGASTNATDEVIATIKGKGWTLKSNGTAL